MIGFLDYKDQRIIKILIALTINQERIKLDSIMTFNECSQRTVYFDLEEIQKRWGHFLQIKSVNREYELCTKNVGNIQDVLAEMLSKSIQFQLLFLILKEPHQAQSYYCRELNISQSMFERAMRKTNDQIQKYRARIRSREGLYFIQAENELVFRFFLVEALHNTESKMRVFSDSCIEDAIKISQFLVEEFKLNYNEIIIYYLSLAILVSILRERSGFAIKNQNNVTISLNTDKLENIVYGCTELEDMSVQELESIILKIVGTIKEYAHIDGRLEAAERAASNFWDLNVNNASLIEKELFVSSLLQFINFTRIYPFHQGHSINRFSLYGIQFLEQHPGIYEYIKQINYKYKVWNAKDFEQYVYIMVFWMSVNAPKLDFSVYEEVLILSDYGKEHAEVIKGIVDVFLENKIYTCKGLLLPNSYHTLSMLIKEGFDLIITNRYSPLLEGQNYVIVNDYPNEKDIKSIQKKSKKRII